MQTEKAGKCREWLIRDIREEMEANVHGTDELWSVSKKTKVLGGPQSHGGTWKKGRGMKNNDLPNSDEEINEPVSFH